MEGRFSRTKNRRRLSGEKEAGEPFHGHRALGLDPTRHAKDDDALIVQTGVQRGAFWLMRHVSGSQAPESSFLSKVRVL